MFRGVYNSESVLLTRPVASILPSISTLRLNITTLYTTTMTTFGFRALMPLRLVSLELCHQNNVSLIFPQLMKPSGVVLPVTLLSSGQVKPSGDISDVALSLVLTPNPITGKQKNCILSETLI